MRESKFIFDSVDALYYNLNKISLSRGGSYIDPPEWLKNKKAAINPKNDDDKCFQYALTVALIYEQSKKDPQRILKINHSFINIIRKKQTPHHIKRTGRSLNHTINQLLLIFCMCLIILKK